MYMDQQTPARKDKKAERAPRTGAFRNEAYSICVHCFRSPFSTEWSPLPGVTGTNSPTPEDTTPRTLETRRSFSRQHAPCGEGLPSLDKQKKQKRLKLRTTAPNKEPARLRSGLGALTGNKARI